MEGLVQNERSGWRRKVCGAVWWERAEGAEERTAEVVVKIGCLSSSPAQALLVVGGRGGGGGWWWLGGVCSQLGQGGRRVDGYSSAASNQRRCRSASLSVAPCGNLSFHLIKPRDFYIHFLFATSSLGNQGYGDETMSYWTKSLLNSKGGS